MRRLIACISVLFALVVSTAIHDARASCDEQAAAVARAACFLQFPEAGQPDLEQSRRAIQALAGDSTKEGGCLRGLAFFNLQQLDRAKETLDDCAAVADPNIKSLTDYARDYLPRTITSELGWPVLEIEYDDENLDLSVEQSGQSVIPVFRDTKPSAKLTLKAGGWSLRGAPPMPRVDMPLSDSGRYKVEVEHDETVSKVSVSVDARDVPIPETGAVVIPLGFKTVKVVLPGDRGPDPAGDGGTSEDAEANTSRRPFRAFLRGDQILVSDARGLAGGASFGLVQTRLVAFEMHPAYIYSNRFMGADVGAGLFVRFGDAIELGPVLDLFVLARYDGVALGTDQTLFGLRPTLGLRWLMAGAFSVVASVGGDLYAGTVTYRSSSGVGSLALEWRFASMP